MANSPGLALSTYYIKLGIEPSQIHQIIVALHLPGLIYAALAPLLY